MRSELTVQLVQTGEEHWIERPNTTQNHVRRMDNRHPMVELQFYKVTIRELFVSIFKHNH